MNKLNIILACGIFFVAGCGAANTAVQTPTAQEAREITIPGGDANYKEYNNKAEAYTVKYPSDFSVEKSANLVMPFTTMKGTFFTFPSSIYFDTNLQNDSGIIIARVKKDKSCAYIWSSASPEQVRIGGSSYFLTTKEDAGAGNFYYSEIYTKDTGEYCYSIAMQEHTINADAMGPGKLLQKFDRKILRDIIIRMAASMVIK